MSDIPEPSPLQRAISAALGRAQKPRDHYDRLLQKELGTKGKPLYDIQRGKSRNPSKTTLEAIESVLELTPGALHTTNYDGLIESAQKKATGTVRDQPKFDHDRSRDIGAEDTILLRKFDLSYAMGPGTNIDDYAESEPFEFDRSLFRKLTLSPQDKCIVVDGIGDSNFPTILDHDHLLIDTAQRVLNQRDRFWAISLYGAGAVKRLRAIGNGRILVMSDNKAVAPDDEVSADDVYILGRVIWLGRRM